ncbi:MAG TPA: hypothetical protein VLD59_13475, partial [Steroidobacteraceae bacterium]|nr:hypothetical protein [Steroidobacteraceae bacterium]
MALVRTNRDQRTSAALFGTGGFASNAFTPSNNSLLVVIAFFIDQADSGSEGTSLTITDSVGLTWTSRAATTGSPAWSYGLRIWTAPVTTGVSMTVTIDCGAVSVDIYRVEVYDYTGYDTTTPVGATATGTDADGDGAASITLSAAPATTSEVIASALTVLNADVNIGITNGAGFTELFDADMSAGFGWSETEVRSGSTST